MKSLLGYKIQSTLYESNSTLVFRANKHNRDSVILKILKSENQSNEEIQRYHNEYTLTRSLKNLPGVIDTYGLERDSDKGKLIMLMEDFGATSLDKLLNQGSFSLEQVLDIAIAVIAGLDEIHCASIIHKDVNPSNIVMNPDDGQVKLIDFGIASAVSREAGDDKGSNVVEGTLPYIPPEQTGRIDRIIDHRADFYSFGATIYELLAHKPPFNRTDQMELIHCHLARKPRPLSGIRADIPEAVSEIVMKLLSKDPGERYATAKGVKADLQKCLDQIEKGERQFSFSLGKEDKGRALKISDQIFGREEEIKRLQSTFHRVPAGGKKIVFVKGPAGIGKTLLIRELEKYVHQNNGIFISGKFNQLEQGIPYSGIIQAFRQLARYLLTRSDEELDNWKKKIKKALGNQGYEIIEWVSEFKKIIGPRLPLSGSGGHETQNRFYLMFENFMGVFSGRRHPLVLFLDDLQWIDFSSLELVRRIILAPIIDSIFIIGAFRDSEINPGHPLRTLLEQLKKEKVEYNNLRLSPLDVSNLSRMISESLDCSRDNARPLSQWIHTRSLGNPLYSQGLLAFLNEREKLVYDTTRKRWNWNLKDIQTLPLPDSITDLLAKKVLALSKHTRNILMLAASMGTTFEMSTLGIVCERSQKEIKKALEESMRAGLILQLKDNTKSAPEKENSAKTGTYTFIHDRIRGAAYNLIPREQRPEFHRQIGRLLLQKLTARQSAARIFEIVNHLNQARILLQYGPEQKDLARHNLEAGQKAKESSAFEQAYTYFMIGIDLLKSNDPEQETSGAHHWHETYELISNLYLGAIEAAYLSTRFDEVDELGEIFLANADSLGDRLQYYSIKVQAFYARNLMEEAVSTALHALGLAGIRIAEKPKKREIVFEYLKTSLLLSRKSMDSLAQLPTATDPEKLTILNIMHHTLLPSYNVNADLFPILVFKAIRIAVRHGSAVNSAFAFSGYGMILSCFLGKLEKGYQFGRLATRMLESFESNELGAKILVTVSVFTTHWKEHLKKVPPLLEQGYEKGLETGDFQFTAIAAHLDSYYRFFLGENLAELQIKADARQKAIKRLKQKTTQLYQNMLLQCIRNLTEKCDTPHKLVGRHYDEDLMLPIHLKANDGGALFKLYLQKTILCFLFDRPQEARDNASAAEKYLSAQRGAATAQHNFYSSLSNLVDLDTKARGKAKRLARVKDNQKEMKKWAKSAPMNYEHKYLLVEAEYRRVKNQPQKAAHLYARAMKKAGQHGFLHEAAIAGELAGRFYLRMNNSDKAREYLEQSWHEYLKWGANTKLSQLEIRYPDLFSTQTKSVSTSFDSVSQTTIATSGEFLDWNAVLDSSVSISSEINFEQLIKKLMRIVIRNTGAQRGILFLRENNQLQEAAAYPLDAPPRKNPSNPFPLENSSHVPKSVIHYVERMKENIIYDEGDTDPLFKNDPYIVAQHPKSLLCFPLQYKAKLMGIIYLENNLVAGTFTSHSLEILKILSAQISVSLENAKLYKDLDGQARKLKSVNKKLQRGIDHRVKMETQLKDYRDQLKKEFDAQAMELLKSKQTLATFEVESSRRRRFRKIIGKNDQMQKIYDLIEDLADVNASVLITGESGTGKELVAEALHTESRRKDHPFVKVNCSALSESVLESELFGHVKGAFTGADKDKIGRFQKAAAGTFLLDEIGDVSLNFQKRLLRVLQEREFERLGDTTTLSMAARVIAATNQNLLERVEQGAFRQDLYYRLKVVEIKLPPLRERKEDIPLLMRHFLDIFNAELDKKIKDVSPEVMRILMAYHWPGNVRELRNTLEHICILCKNTTIVKDDLPSDFPGQDLAYNQSFQTLSNGDDPLAFETQPDDKEALLEALEQAQWNKTRAAEVLGISRRTLYRRLKEYQI
jgi:predicted ATPase/GAF domain-containing protein/tRNA A-37 threonylcarbamoyl transferase component Bud32